MAQATTVQTSEVTARTSKKSPKDRLLLQIKSLDESDDERTSISKRVSWILRRGAATAGVRQDPRTKWVKFSDLCSCGILNEFSEELIWQIIVDFNGKKLRYEISEDPGGPWLRAYKRDSKEGKPNETSAGTSSAPAPQQPQETQAPSLQAQPQWQDPQQQATQQAVAFAAAQPQQMNQMAYWNYAWPMMTPWMNPYMWQHASAAAPGKGQGRIKSINTEKGFGFIESPWTYSLYHRDVFLHKAQLGDLQVGSIVQFTYEVNKQGMPQAREVQALAGMPYMQPPGPPADSKGGKGGKDGKGKGGKGRGKGCKKGKNDGGTKDKPGDRSDKGDKEITQNDTTEQAESKEEGATESVDKVASARVETATEAAS